MVNSLTSKLQIGSPMACLYLLENPDHYTNLTFKEFNAPADPIQMNEADEIKDDDADDENDHVVLHRADGKYVGTTSVDDYIHRPSIFENTSLYEFFKMNED
ncbi:hypothetical protein B0H13DRAFT_1645298 [Mycena leptocephala]|nr:hypothetical protein B0H13DRAFT_1645298 [Mycena leptocephala]